MPASRDSRLSIAVLVAAAATALVAFVYVAAAFTERPDNPVEAELIFEATRIARGFPLYVDPSSGAWEGGGPPSRYFVLYTPTWPWLLAHLGGTSVSALRIVGRAIATVAWLGAFLLPVAVASRRRRVAAATAACLALGVYFLARNAPSATPDTLAALLACVGLVRAARRGHFDPLSAMFVIAAPFVKPSCLGIVAGAAIAHLVARQVPRRLPTLGAAAFFAALGAAACHGASGGAWLDHLVRSTGQPLSLTRFVQEFGARALVLGVPHALVLIVAIRRRAAITLTAPLATSLAWSAFAMAKHGSGTQYWIEPTVAALVALTFMPAALGASRGGRFARLGGGSGGAALAVVIVLVTSIVGYAGELTWWQARAAELTAIDARCVREPGELVVSSDAPLELALDGRVVVPDWQSAFLARRGKFPAGAWRNDLADPRVRWIVLERDPYAPLPENNDARVEVSAFRDVLRPALDREYVRSGTVGHLFVFRHQPPSRSLESEVLVHRRPF